MSALVSTRHWSLRQWICNYSGIWNFDLFKTIFIINALIINFLPHEKLKNVEWTWFVPFVLLSCCMIYLHNHVKTTRCNYKQWSWNRLSLFSPALSKIDVTFKPDNQINVPLLAVVNEVAIPIKQTFWFYYFVFFCNIGKKLNNFFLW